MSVDKANFQDALDIAQGVIVMDGKERGYVTGLSLDGKSPEDVINCIGGTLRRRKPETVEWSVDSAVMYDNVKDLQDMKGGKKFNIELYFVNPDSSDANNLGQKIVVRECTVQDHSISFSDSSTFKMSGRAKSWEVTPGYTGE